MKKKLLALVLFSALMAVSCSFALVGCTDESDDGGETAGSGSGETQETNGGQGGTGALSSDDGNGGSVEQEMPHTCTYDQKVVTEMYLKSVATCTQKAVYYFSCTCGEKGTETFEFGEVLQVTDGLEFTLNEAGTEYAVTGIGTVTDTDIVIPAEYNGLPVTEIGKGAFMYCRKIRSVNIPYGVASIGEEAFGECYSLEEVNLPNSITSVGFAIFAYCEKLSKVIIPNSVENIAQGAFAICQSFTDFYTDGTNPYYYVKDGCLIERATKTLIAGCQNSVIPANGEVTSLGFCSFCGCTGLKKIVIPEGVTNIEDAAFMGCVKLMSVTLPNSLTFIAEEAFQACPKIVEVYNHSALSLTKGSYDNGMVARYTFDIYTANEQSKLTKTAEDFVFYENENAVYLMDYVGTQTDLTLPESYNGKRYELYRLAFTFTPVKSVIVPKEVSLGIEQAFQYSLELKDITIGNTVTSIGTNMFYECRKLTNIIFQGTKEEWKAIEKDISWDSGTGNYTVTCTDGKLGKDGKEMD